MPKKVVFACDRNVRVLTTRHPCCPDHSTAQRLGLAEFANTKIGWLHETKRFLEVPLLSNLAELPGWLLSAVGSGLVSIIVGLIFADAIKSFFARFLRIGKVDPLPGKWVGSFFHGDPSDPREYTEVLLIKKKFGSYIGSVVPDARNYEKLKSVTHKSPVKFRGEKTSDHLLTGVWYHPIETARSHGAFQLQISSSGDELTGVWIGYSQSKSQIDNGKWTLTRA